MSPRRGAAYLSSAVVVAGLLTSPVALAAPHDGTPPTVKSVIGHLAYLTKHGLVKVSAVHGSGHTSKPTRIGPVTKVTGNRRVQISFFVASGDGDWIAWQEYVTKPNGDPAGPTPMVVLRDLKHKQLFQLKTGSYPVGFAGDQLVTAGNHASSVDLQPTPHLVPVPGKVYPTSAYPGGVVDVKPLSSPPGPKSTERLRLNSFTGTHTTLHNYVLARNDPRLPEQTFTSGDGKYLIVERGDHTDFGGVGPSSLVDEFALDGSRTRTTLGHFGTAKAAWRVGGVSFAWPSDEVWAVWERATKHGAASAIAVDQNGFWRQILAHGIAVAGTRDGYVVAQPGKYVFGGADGLEVTRVPTGDAVLIHGKSNPKVLGIEGSEFAWVA